MFIFDFGNSHGIVDEQPEQRLRVLTFKQTTAQTFIYLFDHLLVFEQLLNGPLADIVLSAAGYKVKNEPCMEKPATYIQNKGKVKQTMTNIYWYYLTQV